MKQDTNYRHLPLWARLRALRFYDMGKLAREVKGDTLGIDINRHFASYKGTDGGTKGGFADWILANLDHELIEAGIDPYETESQKYYSGEKAKPTVKTGIPVPTTAAPTAPTQAKAEPTMQTQTKAVPANIGGVDSVLSVMINAAIQNALAEFKPDAATATDMSADLMAEVDKRIAHGLASVKPTVITVVNGNTTATTTLGRQHKGFDTLLKLASIRKPTGGAMNIWLTGPAGSGKTTAARNVAKALNLSYHFTGAIADEFKLLGYMDAAGRYVRTPFREAYEHGGVFLMDECDGSAASAILALNAALANGHCDFADGNVDRHPDCIVIAAANTWGTGATREYIGRTEIDSATLDRFVMMEWGYDEALEVATCGDEAWAKVVIRYRKAVANAHVQHMVTPRASYEGAVLLASGMKMDDVIDMLIRKGMPDDQWQTVTSRV